MVAKSSEMTMTRLETMTMLWKILNTMTYLQMKMAARRTEMTMIDWRQ